MESGAQDTENVSPGPSTIIPTTEIDADDAVPLGGTISAVFRGTWNGIKVAIKRFSNDTTPEALHSRIGSWTSAKHANILRVFGASPHDADPLYIVTELHENGNISQFLAQNPTADKPQLLLQAALGMQFLHGCGMVHGSLKPSNILVNDDGHALVADCGINEIIRSANPCAHHYFSPEAWKGTTSRASDVFAFAMCVFDVLAGKRPWGTLQDDRIYHLVVKENERPDRPERDVWDNEPISDQIWEILEDAWVKDARARPDFVKIISLWPGATAPAEPSSPPPQPPSQLLGPPHLNTSAARQLDIFGRSGSEESIHTALPLYERVASGSHMSHIPGHPPVPVQGSRQRASGRGFGLPRLPPPPPLNLSAHRPSSTSSVDAQQQYLRSSPQPMEQFVVAQSPPRSIGSDELSANSLPGDVYFDQSAGTFPTPLWSGFSSPPATAQMFTGASNPARMSRASSRSGSDTGSSHSGGWGNASARTTSMRGPPYSQPYDANSSPPSIPRRVTLRPGFGTIEEVDLAQNMEALHMSDQYLSRMNTTTVRSGTDGVPETNQQLNLGASWRDSLQGYPSETSGVSTLGGTSAFHLAGAFNTELNQDGDFSILNDYMARIQQMASNSDKDTQRLITAGVVQDLITLLRRRATDYGGLEIVLVTLGTMAHDSVSANMIFRVGATQNLMELINGSLSDDVAAGAVWCISRICRTKEVADELIKRGVVQLLTEKGLLHGTHLTSRLSAWCLGTLVRCDSQAEAMASRGLIQISVDHLISKASSPNVISEDICAATFLIARLARTIKLSKALTKAGCVRPLVHALSTSEDPDVLNWSSRAIGCLMRPNSLDMAKALLEAGSAAGLARLPRVLPQNQIEPLASFAFAIQRFVCAEWGGGTRKALVEAGVVDSLLSALRTAADVPAPHVHIELARAVTFLCDIGGGDVRKEIIRAGGVDILKQVGQNAKSEVAKVCSVAVTSVTGNLWARNAAVSKTALKHDWSGGCPDYLPPQPHFSQVVIDASEGIP
ncbi:uncharacterized protein EI90DRAFT_2975570 [Cantharellus anzutake]|uniref:uncharacterized protein n=1 Tax=Cantharellus anzutake TaxID=1750568 RepID=UPI0019038297|nr:uncharacterized protein EI90DRAFT_2975570 [Cantharellus anzutake]KAF8326525.1 hypothetical protein EI90DRAFT_2975570 [Cantharellus anzutake]